MKRINKISYIIILNIERIHVCHAVYMLRENTQALATPIYPRTMYIALSCSVLNRSASVVEFPANLNINLSSSYIIIIIILITTPPPSQRWSIGTWKWQFKL